MPILPEMATEEATFLTWTRPALPAAPVVWGRYEHAGVRYVVRDATADLHDRMLQLYVREYFHDEPASRSAGLGDDEVSAAEYSFLIAKALAQGCSLVALEESADAEPEMVGGMILPVLSAADPPLPEVSGAAVRVLMGLNLALRSSAPHCDPLTRRPTASWGGAVPRYMCDLGMHVRRDRRRRGLGAAILGCVPAVARALGVPHFSTLFTGATSQAMAASLGLKEMARIKYAEVVDEDGQPSFPGIAEESCILFGVDVEVDSA